MWNVYNLGLKIYEKFKDIKILEKGYINNKSSVKL